MSSATKEFTIYRAKNQLLGTLCMVASVTFFCWIAFLFDSQPALWALPILLAIAYLWAGFRSPIAVVFRPELATIEQVYRVNALAPRSRISKFSDWSGIQSRIAIETEEQLVSLELRDDRYNRLVLDSSPPVVTSSGWKLSWEDYDEPEHIRVLRKKIADMMNVQDLGFCRPTYH